MYETMDPSVDPKKEGFVKRINTKVTKNLKNLRIVTIGISIVLIFIYGMNIVKMALSMEIFSLSLYIFNWYTMPMFVAYVGQAILLILII